MAVETFQPDSAAGSPNGATGDSHAEQLALQAQIGAESAHQVQQLTEARQIGRLASFADRMQDRATGVEPMSGSEGVNHMFELGRQRLATMREAFGSRIDTIKAHTDDVLRIGRAAIHIGVSAVLGTVGVAGESVVGAADTVGGVLKSGADRTSETARTVARKAANAKTRVGQSLTTAVETVTGTAKYGSNKVVNAGERVVAHVREDLAWLDARRADAIGRDAAKVGAMAEGFDARAAAHREQAAALREAASEAVKSGADRTVRSTLRAARRQTRAAVRHEDLGTTHRGIHEDYTARANTRTSAAIRHASAAQAARTRIAGRS